MILPRPEGAQPGISCRSGSLLEVLAAGGAAGIAGQEAEHEDPDEEENDRVNRDLEGEHWFCPAVTGSDGRQVGP